MRYSSIAIAGVLILGLSGCSPSTFDPDAARPNEDEKSVVPADPKLEVTDTASDFFVADTLAPLLDEAGIGPASFEVARPAASLDEIRYYVTCSPAGEFTVTMDTTYTSSCAPEELISSGGFPIPAGTDPLAVTLDVPADMTYWITAIPMQR